MTQTRDSSTSFYLLCQYSFFWLQRVSVGRSSRSHFGSWGDREDGSHKLGWWNGKIVATVPADTGKSLYQPWTSYLWTSFRCERYELPFCLGHFCLVYFNYTQLSVILSDTHARLNGGYLEGSETGSNCHRRGWIIIKFFLYISLLFDILK